MKKNQTLTTILVAVTAGRRTSQTLFSVSINCKSGTWKQREEKMQESCTVNLKPEVVKQLFV